MSEIIRITPERFERFLALPLALGEHKRKQDEMCIAEAQSYLAEEPWSDHPACVDEAIAAIERVTNDRVGTEARQLLKPYVIRAMGTAGDLDTSVRRAFLAVDWSLRDRLPHALDIMELAENASAVRALPEFVDAASIRAALPVLDEAWKAAEKWALDALDALDARAARAARAALDALDARAARDALDALDALDARAALDALDARAARREAEIEHVQSVCALLDRMIVAGPHRPEYASWSVGQPLPGAAAPEVR